MKTTYYISRISRDSKLVYRIIRHHEKDREIVSEHATLRDAIKQLLKIRADEERDRKYGTKTT